MNVTKEELKKSLDYLDEFEKGLKQQEIEGGEPAQEEDALKVHHQKKMCDAIKKARFHKEIVEKIEKGEALPDEAFEEDPEEEKKSEDPEEEKKSEAPKEDAPKEEAPVEKGAQTEELNKGVDIEEIVKGAVSEALNAQATSHKEEIEALKKSFSEELEKISKEPVRKSLIKGADGMILQKALSGEKVDDKTVLSATMQKGQVSQALYSAYEAETDSIVKGRLAEAVSVFEAGGGYISPETAKIMDAKGYKIIQ